MNEYLIGYTAAGSIITLGIGSVFYMMGGRAKKWLRRYIASLLQALNCNICSLIMGTWSFPLLLIYPLLIGGFSLGYGGEEFWTKFWRRLVFCLAQVCVALVFCLRYGGACWLILPVHLAVSLCSIYLGIRNPIHAAAEEVFVFVTNNLMLCAYPFAKLG